MEIVDIDEKLNSELLEYFKGLYFKLIKYQLKYEFIQGKRMDMCK